LACGIGGGGGGGGAIFLPTSSSFPTRPSRLLSPRPPSPRAQPWADARRPARTGPPPPARLSRPSPVPSPPLSRPAPAPLPTIGHRVARNSVDPPPDQRPGGQTPISHRRLAAAAGASSAGRDLAISASTLAGQWSAQAPAPAAGARGGVPIAFFPPAAGGKTKGAAAVARASARAALTPARRAFRCPPAAGLRLTAAMAAADAPPAARPPHGPSRGEGKPVCGVDGGTTERARLGQL
ncbi:hypothetical protein BU14_2624s0001, partial [Porphyra umbilicalis]